MEVRDSHLLREGLSHTRNKNHPHILENCFWMWSQEDIAVEKLSESLMLLTLKVNELGAGHMQRNVSCLQKPKGRKEIFPQNFQRNADTFFLDQQDPCQIPKLQNGNIIDLCCFRPSSVWKCVTTVTEI